MPAWDTLMQFFLASIALGLAPGPDNIYVLTQSAVQGRNAGIVITLGLCTGLVLHTALVALGVAALIATSPLLFMLLKLGGAGYLLYLAYQAFRADGAAIGTGSRAVVAYRHLYKRGLLMNISNPKVSMFFLAFLPQFVEADGAAVSQQMIVLGGTFIVATLLVFNAIALMAAGLATKLRSSATAQRVLYRITGVVLMLLALRLLLYQA
ncbi:MAG: LysE family translocator [Desulfuromonadaceae bacterium]|nr:LysE family translocator [Desulfuromonadaceae bacterium]